MQRAGINLDFCIEMGLKPQLRRELRGNVTRNLKSYTDGTQNQGLYDPGRAHYGPLTLLPMVH